MKANVRSTSFYSIESRLKLFRPTFDYFFLLSNDFLALSAFFLFLMKSDNSIDLFEPLNVELRI